MIHVYPNNDERQHEMTTEPRFPVEWHYAPMTGDLAKRVNGQWEILGGGWEQRHRDMAEFLNLKASGSIIFRETITYGHPHFHGHSGRVDVYSATDA